MTKPKPVLLTEVEVDHLLTLLRDAEHEGSYYGRQDHYWKRHAQITAKLIASVEDQTR
jgi:hypothetical protein